MRFGRRMRSFMFAARWFRCCADCARRWPRRMRPGMSAATSRARDSTWRSSCTPGPAPTSAVRRPRCSTRRRAAAASPSLRPPFPAESGLYGCPTVVNNVETIASVPSIIFGGVDWFRSMGSDKSPGFTLYSLSGHVTRPGQYEAPLGITLGELLDYAGGVRAGHRLKFWTPGGSSTPILTDEHLDVPLDYEGVGAVGSMLGTKALQIFDETTCVVRAVRRWTQFYKHESCGKCTPCRE